MLAQGNLSPPQERQHLADPQENSKCSLPVALWLELHSQSKPAKLRDCDSEGQWWKSPRRKDTVDTKCLSVC